MDQALACLAGSWGLNPDTHKDFSAPILSGLPPCALSQSLLSRAPA